VQNVAIFITLHTTGRLANGSLIKSVNVSAANFTPNSFYAQIFISQVPNACIETAIPFLDPPLDLSSPESALDPAMHTHLYTLSLLADSSLPAPFFSVG